ncbi:MAG: mandelate racemase/muconate lactonizing enzyme family protein [Actinomycetota bacterium]
MQISRVDVFQVDLPYAGGTYRLSGGRTYTAFDATIVRITTDDGLTGWGESTPFGSTYVAAHAAGVRAGIAEVAPGLIGRDPRRVDRINDRMDELLVGHRHAKTAMDVACWDVFGRSVGLPVCDLLGGRIEGPMPIISSIHQGDPSDMRARVADHRARGYRGHSIKIGASEAEGGPALDAERVGACLADARPGEYFIADANGGLSVEHAIRLIRLLPSDADIVLEAPCATWRETVTLRRQVSVPIILDELADSEESVVRMIADNVGDGIGLKVSKNGGLTACRRQRDIATAAGFTMSVQDTVGSDIAFAAVVHLGQTVARHLLRCVLDVRDMVALTTAALDVPVVDGGVLAPDQPGLGVTPDLAVLGDPVLTFS